MDEQVKDDERIVWVREKPGRKIVQTIEPMPVGFSVTTQWWDGEHLYRQDCQVSIRDVSTKTTAERIGRRPVVPNP